MKTTLSLLALVLAAACALSHREVVSLTADLETPLFEVVSRRAIEGDRESQNLLGYLLFFGEHAPLDRRAAAAWFRRAAAAGHPSAQVNMALLHALGVGVPRDWEAAQRHLRAARANPDAEGAWRWASLETLVVSACAGTQAAEARPTDLYDRFCAGCHGWNGIATYRGSPSFALGDRLEKSDDELLGSIVNGLGTMPAWGDKLPVSWLRETIPVLRSLESDFQDGVIHRLREPPGLFFRFGPMASDWSGSPHGPSTAYGNGVAKDPTVCAASWEAVSGDPVRASLTAATLAAALAAQADAGHAQDTLVLPDSLPPGVTAAMVASGREVFEGKGLCYTCHGAEAGGLIGPTLTDPNWWYGEGSYLAIVRQILVGVPADQSTSGVAMPALGGSDIAEADVLAVAAFVWRVSHPRADSLPPGVSEALIARGDRVFHGPGRCLTCHGYDAGGAVGPDLTDETWLHAKGSYLTILQQVLVGVPSARSRTGIEMPPRGGAALTDAEVQSVAAYVWALSRGAP